MFDRLTNFPFIEFILGLDFDLMYLPALVSVSAYFVRKRSSAMGIAVCGTGLGTLVFPAIMPYIINGPLWFDYDGALLLESGIILICIIFGALMVKSRDRKLDFNEYE